tara:strand:- start:419 stop:628 length:210 start_codon:yes stop_codon:yes gene_type:complete
MLLNVKAKVAALNHVIDVLKLIGIQDVKLLEFNTAHVVLLGFSRCEGQTVGADINSRNLSIFVATGVDD